MSSARPLSDRFNVRFVLSAPAPAKPHEDMMLTLITNADIHAPEAIGTGSVLLGGGKILLAGPAVPEIDDALLSGVA